MSDKILMIKGSEIVLVRSGEDPSKATQLTLALEEQLVGIDVGGIPAGRVRFIQKDGNGAVIEGILNELLAQRHEIDQLQQWSLLLTIINAEVTEYGGSEQERRTFNSSVMLNINGRDRESDIRGVYHGFVTLLPVKAALDVKRGDMYKLREAIAERRELRHYRSFVLADRVFTEEQVNALLEQVLAEVQTDIPETGEKVDKARFWPSSPNVGRNDGQTIMLPLPAGLQLTPLTLAKACLIVKEKSVDTLLALSIMLHEQWVERIQYRRADLTMQSARRLLGIVNQLNAYLAEFDMEFEVIREYGEAMLVIQTVDRHLSR